MNFAQKKIFMLSQSRLYSQYSLDIFVMENVNWWILAPCLILLALVAIPMIHIGLRRYSSKMLCCSSTRQEKSEETSEIATGTTDAPEITSNDV